jgi:amino-acid N-acetyltransferase
LFFHLRQLPVRHQLHLDVWQLKRQSANDAIIDLREVGQNFWITVAIFDHWPLWTFADLPLYLPEFSTVGTAVADYVKFFRDTSPYINAHRGKTFVIAISGDGVLGGNFSHIIHDVALLNTLGIRIVLVHGARPQIEERLAAAGLAPRFHLHQRITDEATMACVKDAVGSTRIAIEAMLSLGLANSPMHGARLRVVSGNFISAKPVGVRDGIDHHLTGEVRKIDAQGIRRQLDDNAIVLLSSLGYSATGEAFNLTYENVATEAAVALRAEKLILFTGDEGIRNGQGDLLRLLPLEDVPPLLEQPTLEDAIHNTLAAALYACKRGVPRAHLISFHKDGALLGELFTRAGEGTLVLPHGQEIVRQAALDDVPGLLDIIAPLEEKGVLVKRSRELLEREISRFYLVVDAENIIVACAALYPFSDGVSAEMACVATHDDYQNRGFAAKLLDHIEKRARDLGIGTLFVLTTQTAHWFLEQGFAPATVEALPAEKKELYNYQRNSKVFCKPL